MGHPLRQLDLVSPYFVPTEQGVARLNALVARGVKVRVLTNSLAATDVAPVHAGYAKYREALLRGERRIAHLGSIAEHRRGHRAEDVDVEALPHTLRVRLRKAGEAGADGCARVGDAGAGA